MNDKAKEFADNIDYKRNKKLTKDIVIDIFNKGFCKGIEFERKKWHNLEENPNDLPNNGEYVICEVKNGLLKYYSGVYNDKFILVTIESKYDVLKWRYIK